MIGTIRNKWILDYYDNPINFKFLPLNSQSSDWYDTGWSEGDTTRENPECRPDFSMTTLGIYDKDTTVFDLGANHGFYAMGFAQMAKHVYAIDPSPECIKSIRINSILNDVEHKITPLAYAMGNGERVEYDSSRQECTLSSKGILSVKFDTIFFNAGKVEFPNIRPNTRCAVKIDCEGWEGFILEGMEKSLKHEALEVVFVEMHPFIFEKYGWTEWQIIQLLENPGFKVEKVNGHLFATRYSRIKN